MGWSFRESIKILPGVRLGFSRKGVSASLGTKGLHLGVGGGRAPRVTGGIGPLHYYRSLGTKRSQPRYVAPSRARLLSGAAVSICLLLGLLCLPPHWITTHLQACAPQIFPASWAAGTKDAPGDLAPGEPSPYAPVAVPKAHHPRSKAANRTPEPRR